MMSYLISLFGLAVIILCVVIAAETFHHWDSRPNTAVLSWALMALVILAGVVHPYLPAVA